MKRFFFFMFLLPLMVHGQLIEHFDDGDFIKNPPWQGNVDRFTVNEDGQLQLNAREAGQAYLATTYSRRAELEWQFWVKADFSPSSNNFIRVFLMSNDEDLTSATQAYYIQLGESGTDDAVELFRMDGNRHVLICSGPVGAVAQAFHTSIKISRDSLGNWTLFAGAGTNGSFAKSGQGFDNSLVTDPVFGFFCQYTASNAKKMFFDDVYVGSPRHDTVSPSVKSIKALSENALQLCFSEPLCDSIAEQTVHYQRWSTGEHPLSAILLPGDTLVKLQFETPFESGVYDSLAISGLEDWSGNSMDSVVAAFFYYLPEAFDVVINELMADPTPPVGLPEAEYLELYNRKSFDIDLSGWQLFLGNSLKVFGKAILPANGYLLVGKEDASSKLKPFGLFYGFSSFSLTNGGELIQLEDPEGKLISRVSYVDSWYHDKDKANGGWSLESINPDNGCSGEENWKASTNVMGGTPGAKNSVFDDVVFRPEVNALEVINNRELQICFSQQMDTSDSNKLSVYTLLPGGVPPDELSLVSSWPTVVRLHFPVSLDSNTLYTLQVSTDISNCLGVKMIADTSLTLGLPAKAQEKDIIINEILFHPFPGGVDYVELYNRSDKVVDLSESVLAGVQKHPPAPDDTLYVSISPEQLLMLPGQYLVLTVSPETVKNQYTVTNPDAFVKMNDFPALPDQKGCVLLYQQHQFIDGLSYSENMQYPLLNSFAGVALERVSFSGESNNPNNWHSASESAGFGTPGYQNSQFIGDSVVSGDIIIEPAIFSPDNDGYEDNLSIKYHFQDPGNTVQITIFNRAGQLVRKLVNNEYVGVSGLFLWNGLMENNTKAPPGIYVFYIKVFDTNGRVKVFKRVAVLAVPLK
jgi:hypothetical protein